MILARSALAALEVVLEVRVPGTDLDDAREGGVRERRAPEVGMDEDSRRIQHASERVSPHPCELLEYRIDEGSGITARLDLLTRSLQRVSCRRQRELARLGG